MHDMARHPRLPGSPAVPRSAQPELLLGNALHLAPLLWGFICLQHAMHRGDPFPRCFGGPDQTALVRPPPATRQKLNPRKQTAASPCPELQCGYGLRGRGQTTFPGPARSLTGPCRPFAGPCRLQGWRVPAFIEEFGSRALLASWQWLAWPVYRWVFVLAVRRFPAHLYRQLAARCTPQSV